MKLKEYLSEASTKRLKEIDNIKKRLVLLDRAVFFKKLDPPKVFKELSGIYDDAIDKITKIIQKTEERIKPRVDRW